MTRRATVAKVQIARKELGLDEDTYRSILERLTGHRSASDASDDDLRVVLEEFKAKGWTPRVVPGGRASKAPAARRRPAADHPSAKKARALWLSLWNLGEVRDPSEAALEAFGRRQLKVEALQWADQALCYKLIEALKAMAERAGWSQDITGYPKGTDLIRVLKVALFRRQEGLLSRLDPERMSEGDQAEFINDRELDDRIAENGRHIRAELTRQAAG